MRKMTSPLSPEEFQQQMDKIIQINQAAKKEEWLLDQFFEERKRTISSIVAEAWKARTLPNKPFVIDPLLARKFRTKVGYASIRLDKLLLELDNVQSMGDETIRDRRREEVRYLQYLLKRADALNAKANRLVEFQEKLTELGKLGKRTLLSSFEAKNVSDKESDIDAAAKRKFATESQRTDHQDQEKMEEEEENTSESDSDSDSSENPAERYYREMMGYKPQHKQKTSKKTEKLAQKRAALEAVSDEEEDQIPSPTAARQKVSPARSSYVREQELVEPQYTIEEVPRAYVITIRDPHVWHAKVGMNEDGVLIVAVPGKAPLKYSLGSNINTNGITKEVQGPYMRLVLPKKPERHTTYGWPTGHADPISLWGGRRGTGDFWSRF